MSVRKFYLSVLVIAVIGTASVWAAYSANPAPAVSCGNFDANNPPKNNVDCLQASSDCDGARHPNCNIHNDGGGNTCECRKRRKKGPIPMEVRP